MEILIEEAPSGLKREKPADESSVGFGNYFSDHMFLMDYEEGSGWKNPRIKPYGPFSIDPAALVLHYGQEIFEGMKAYRTKDNVIQLFRPKDNFSRMNRSAERMCMPALDVGFALESLKAMLRLDADWVPRSRGASLYIRPTMIATHASLGVKVSPEYLFYIISGPVGPYYPKGFSPTRIMVADEHVRAVPGGVGAAKTSGNYAASLLAGKQAYEKGYSQVLWLDGIHRNYVEEVGTSNIFFLIGDELVTPPLSGSILPGITRDSVITMARGWGICVEERPISIEEVKMGIASGILKESFATGTAAVISPVGEISHKGEKFIVNSGATGELSRRLYNELLGIQYGDLPDPYGWVETIYEDRRPKTDAKSR